LNFKILLLILIPLLTQSTLTDVDAIIIYESNQNQENFEHVLKDSDEEQATNFIPTSYKVNLQENLSIIENKLTNTEENFNHQIVNHYKINLQERVNVSSENYDPAALSSIKHQTDKKAIMERIMPTQLSRMLSDTNIFKQKSSTLQLITNDDWYDTSVFATPFVLTNSDTELVGKHNFSMENVLLNSTLTPQKQFDDVYQTLIDINYVIIDSGKSLVSVNNPVTLLFTVFLVGYIFIRTENQKIEFYNFRRVFCFVFVTILMSSAVLTPLSISSSYWGIAYAEEFPSDPSETLDNSVPEFNDSVSIVPSNATAIEAVNAISTEPEPEPTDSVNAKSVEPVNATSVEPVNATTVEPVDSVEATTEPVGSFEATVIENFQNFGSSTIESVEPVNATSVEPVNATTIEPVNVTSVEPVSATSSSILNSTMLSSAA